MKELCIDVTVKYYKATTKRGFCSALLLPLLGGARWDPSIIALLVLARVNTLCQQRGTLAPILSPLKPRRCLGCDANLDSLDDP